MFKKLQIFIIFILVSTPLLAEDRQANKKEVSEKVDALIEKMSLEEKAGQMTQITVHKVFDFPADGKPTVNDQKLAIAVQRYGVGSILNVPGTALNFDDWHQWLNRLTKESEKTRLKIPVIYGIDSIHGATYVDGADLFPHNIGIAAARSTDLAYLAAEITAKETLASGIKWNFDPVLDVARNPLWPRFEETFGEDSLLVSELGVAMIKAYLDHDIAPTMKHFVGYSVPDNGKDRTPAHISDKELWQIHMPPFAAAVIAGAPSIMVNSGSVNAIPSHTNKYLLTDILRKTWGFDGVIVSDWEDVIRLHTRHKVAATPELAVKMAIDAGLDISMVPEDFSFAEHVVALVKKGKLTEARIDESVRRILTMKFELGLFEHAYLDKKRLKNINRKDFANQALRIANRSMTLLKNNNDILPLKKDQHILLAGPAADSLAALNGSWSYSWQGNDDSLFADSVLSLAKAMTSFAGDKVNTVSVRPFEASENVDIKRFNEQAFAADVIVLALGEAAYAESPGSINELTLAQDQIALAKAAYATGKPVVLVLLQGRPRIIREIEAQAAGILLAYRPGTQGGQAITQTLYGINNPSGILPFSYPRYSGDIMAYDHYPLARFTEIKPPNLKQNGYYPQWPFGHGLSYTRFSLTKLKSNIKRFKPTETVKLSVQVKNTGKRLGRKVIDVYVSDHYALESPAVKKLREFSSVELKPGQKKTLHFELDIQDFSYVNNKGETRYEAGTYSVTVGDQSIDLELIQ